MGDICRRQPKNAAPQIYHLPLYLKPLTWGKCSCVRPSPRLCIHLGIVKDFEPEGPVTAKTSPVSLQPLDRVLRICDLHSSSANAHSHIQAYVRTANIGIYSPYRRDREIGIRHPFWPLAPLGWQRRYSPLELYFKRGLSYVIMFFRGHGCLSML